MRRIALSAAGFALVLATLEGLLAPPAGAEHDDFRYKWPYAPGTSFSVTGYPYTDHHDCPLRPGHSCTDAWDLVISDDIVRSSAESTPYEVVSNLPEHTCGPNLGLGNNVKVNVPDGRTVYYAHLASTAVTAETRILQGDKIGVQGDTGNTTDGMGGCGEHLHFEFIGGHPAKIDGSANPSQSTNSAVGDYNLPGGAIRQKYWDLGSLFTSWAVAGWTADRSGSQAGCPSGSFCRLYVHYAPNPVTGHWGSKIDFRQHPDAAGYEYSSIMVGRWAVNDAYFVPKGFFATWWAGYGQGIGLPIREVMPANPFAYCVTSTSGCVRWQRFHMGYIWEHNTLGMQPPVFCPDVFPAYPNEDHFVSVHDVLAISQAFGRDPDTYAPYAPWPDARYDVNGDGVITVITDVLIAAQNVWHNCYPG